MRHGEGHTDGGSLNTSAQAQHGRRHTRGRGAARSTHSADSRRIRSSLHTRFHGGQRSSRIGRRASRATKALPRPFVRRVAWGGPVRSFPVRVTPNLHVQVGDP